MIKSFQPRPPAPDASTFPSVSPFLQNGFHRFLTPFLRRSFHTIAVARRRDAVTRQLPPDQPLIIYGNHPSWWDPLIAHFLCRKCFAPRQFYAPIDAEALQKYRVFRKLGFFGVRLGSVGGASAFLKTTRRLLNAPNSSLWLTPEGRFADVRDTTADLAPGLSHLCLRASQGRVMPMAVEYVFWEERLPECLIRFGDPLDLAELEWSKQEWHDQLSQRLRANQADLAKLVIARDSESFEPLLHGARGAGGFYDSFRRMHRWFRGEKFRAEHGDRFH